MTIMDMVVCGSLFEDVFCGVKVGIVYVLYVLILVFGYGYVDFVFGLFEVFIDVFFYCFYVAICCDFWCRGIVVVKVCEGVADGCYVGWCDLLVF